MAIPDSNLYRHAKLSSGWRYPKAGFHSNGKIKPSVLVNGVEQIHREGGYYLNRNQTWIPVGEDAKEAAKERLKRLNMAQNHRLNGAPHPR